MRSSNAFPSKTKATLQVHYSTKLKARSQTRQRQGVEGGANELTAFCYVIVQSMPKVGLLVKELASAVLKTFVEEEALQGARLNSLERSS